MPTSQEHADDSPSILDKLEQFHYKRIPNSLGESRRRLNSSSERSCSPTLSNSSKDFSEDKEIAQNNDSSEGSSTNDTSMNPEIPKHSQTPVTVSTPDNESPIKIVHQRKNKRLILTDSDSDSDGQATKRIKAVKSPSLPKPSATELKPSVQPKKYLAATRIGSALNKEVFSGKEIGLKMMMNAFPKTDVTILQETLVKCDWYAKKAIHVLQENCNPYMCTHFKIPHFLPKVKPEPVSPPKSDVKTDEFPKTIYIKPDPDAPALDIKPSLLEELSTFPGQSAIETQNGHHRADEQGKSLLVPKQEPLEDSSLDEPPVLAPEVELKNDVQDEDDSFHPKVVRRRIHQLSSDDDSDMEIKIVSMASIKPSTVKSERSTAARQSMHEISSDEDNDSRGPPSDNNGDQKDRQKKKKKKKKKKRKDLKKCSDDEQDYSRDELYNSEDSDIDETLTPARESVFNFYRNSSTAELLSIPGFSKKKVDTILHCRPFSSWVDLVTKLQRSKFLSTDMLGAVRDVIVMRDVMAKLMQRCEKIAGDMEKVVAQLNSGGSRDSCITEQPSILTKSLHLAPYQMLGLNWLWVIHQNKLNGILADEMGLGKTIQTIAFLAHIKQEQDKAGFKKKGGPPRRHLIIVPSSTMDNWVREFHVWCPSMNIITYHGSQESRRELRLQIVNHEIEEFDIMVTTYNMVCSSIEDRTLFRRLNFHYIIFDEAHMLKNMASQRYQNLMKVQGERRLLLTGTPLQNNLVELMSLLIFVMPGMFYGKVDQVKQMFASACKSEENRSNYEKERIEHAKRIMKPFVLRRLKNEVLTQLPKKLEKIEECTFTEYQREVYSSLIGDFSERVSKDMAMSVKSNGMAMMMDLRKAANHPLLIRKRYTDSTLRIMSKKMIKEPTHLDASPQLIFEDMQVMSDFELHRLCKNFKSVSSFKLDKDAILDSGKFRYLDKILPDLKKKGSRLLLFSQFTIMLDIMEEYMAIRNYSFLRLDGSTPIGDRQELMDKFNGNDDIFTFLLSTRAGGLGINLTAANVVFLHDIDFNPYNDKQAEDRCHRVGQTRAVTVTRMIMKDSIDEAILKCAQQKLKLEQDITTHDSEDKEEEVKTVNSMLKIALGL